MRRGKKKQQKRLISRTDPPNTITSRVFQTFRGTVSQGRI